MRWLRLWILLALAGAILFPGAFGTLAFTDITTERETIIETTDKDGSDGTGVIEIESEDELETEQTDAELVTITNTVSDEQDATVDLDESLDWEFSDGGTTSTETLDTGDAETYTVNTEDVSSSSGEYLILSQSGSFLFEQDRDVLFEDSETDEEITLEIDGNLNSITIVADEEKSATVTTDDGTDVTDDATLTSSDTDVVTADDGTVTGVDEGDATVTAEYEGEQDTVDVTVASSDITLDIAEEEEKIFMAIGDDETATVTRDDGEDVTSDSTIVSNNIDVVSVSDSTVSASEEGKAVVTAEYEGVEDTVEVTVPGDNVPTDCSEVMYDTDGSGDYIVTTAPELQCISEHDAGGSFTQEDDVDARLPSGFTPPDGGVGFAPIENFEGDFGNSDYYSITNLVIERDGEDNVGLFETLTENSDVSEIYLDGVEITGGISVGGIVGDGQGAEIQEVKVEGSVSGDTQVGGIVGQSDSQEFYLDIALSRTTVTGTDDVGGIIGAATDDRLGLNSIVAVETVEATDGDAGGLVGFADGRGGRAVEVDGGYWDISDDGTTQADALGGGEGLDCACDGLTTSEMQGDSAESEMPELDFSSEWVTRDSDYPIITGMQQTDEFAVTITDSTSPIEGDAIEITAEIENTGVESGEQSVVAEIDGVGSDSAWVELGAGESVTETFVIDTEDGDAGDYSAVVSSNDSQDTSAVTIRKSDTFLVTVTDTNSPIAEGETLEITADITNDGDEEGTNDITLDVGDVGTDSQTETLASGETQTVTMTVDTEVGDAGGHSAVVSSPDDSDSQDITIESDAESDFVVTISDVNEPIEGDAIESTVEVENEGDESDEQSISFEIDGLGSDSKSVALDSGEMKTLTYTIDTEDGDAGDYTAVSSSADDSDSTPVTVLVASDFIVTIDDISEPYEGDPVDVTVDIENSGNEEDTQDINLDIDGLGSDTQSVTVGDGATETITLSVGTGDGDGGDYDTTVTSEDDTDTTMVSVLQPPVIESFNVVDDNHPNHKILDVDFEAEAGSVGIDEAELEMINDGTGNVVDSESWEYDGAESVSEEAELDENQAGNDDHTVRLTITDENGVTTVSEEDA